MKKPHPERKPLHVSTEASGIISDIAHGLKTPVQTILGLCDLLLDSNLDPEQREYVRMLVSSTDYLTNLLSNLTDLSTLEKRTLKLEEVDFELSTMLEEVVEAAAQGASEKGLELACHQEPEIPSVLVGNGRRLQQILSSLVTTAVENSSTGEVIVP